MSLTSQVTNGDSPLSSILVYIPSVHYGNGETAALDIRAELTIAAVLFFAINPVIVSFYGHRFTASESSSVVR